MDSSIRLLNSRYSLDFLIFPKNLGDIINSYKK